MEIIDPGHRYELDNMDGGTTLLQFIKKAPVEPGSAILETVMNGTTNEEVVAALVDRMRFLDENLPCDENKAIITALEEVQVLIAQRKLNRTDRGVLGTNNA